MKNEHFVSGFQEIFEFLNDNVDAHRIGSEKYQELSSAIARFIAGSDLVRVDNSFDFWNFGQIKFGYFEMGAITSLDLFGVDELIVLWIYWKLNNTVRNSLDLGANLGLHSIAMARLGWSLKAYEPDPVHFSKLVENASANNVIELINPVSKAIWIDNSGVEFTRVLGNTTGNHISGMKTPYGELEKFEVETDALVNQLSDIQLVKMDVEGAEGHLFTSLMPIAHELRHLNAVLEVSESSRQAVYEFAVEADLLVFCQKLGWEPAKAFSDLPTSHREGSVLLSADRPF